MTEHKNYRGAEFGRSDFGDIDTNSGVLAITLELIDEGGYDTVGSYWGVGDPLWNISNETGSVSVYYRCADIESVKTKLRGHYPSVVFADELSQDEIQNG